jgi:putative Mg2+ transporter-C (MgtC) family protein
MHTPFSRSMHTSGSSALHQSQNSLDGEQKTPKHRRRLIMLAVLGVAVALFLPLKAASAASTVLAAEPLVEASSAAAAAAASTLSQTYASAESLVEASSAAATAAASTLSQTYASNPPMTILRIGSPVSREVELRLTLRIFYSALVGAAVGKERSGSNHQAAGVRTMALVCSGAAVFTICSMYGFAAAGRYDPSRMAANVASGVGFVGAGVITTTSAPMQSGEDRHESIVHGLTTAAAIWLSAAIGVACGVGMPILGTAAAFTTVAILRVGRVAKRIRSKRKTRVVPPLREGQDMVEQDLMLQSDTLAHGIEDEHVIRQQMLDRAWNETQTGSP